MESKQSAWNKNKSMYAKRELEKKQYEIAVFMNWFIKHYSTATIDGMLGYVDSMDNEVTLKEIIKEYFKNK